MLEVIVCGINVIIGAVLVYGLKRQWRWLTDPPEWMFAFYFPAIVKIVHGPKHVPLFAYIAVYGTLLMSLACLIPGLINLIQR